MKNYANAWECVTQCSSLSPFDAIELQWRADNLKGKIYEHNNDIDKALSAYRNFIDSFEKHRSALYMGYTGENLEEFMNERIEHFEGVV